MSSTRDLSGFVNAGREARIGRRKSNPPAGLDHAEHTAWIGGYYEQVGYERAGGVGSMNLYDTDERTFCSKCRAAGARRHFEETARMAGAAESQNEAALAFAD